MVDLLLMHWTAEVLIQGSQGAEASLTNIAPIPRTIPSSGSGQRWGSSVFIVPADLFVGKDMIGIDFAAVLVDLLTIDARCTGSGFEV